MNERPAAIAALLCSILGVICFLLMLYFSNISDTADSLFLLFIAFIFFALLLGTISLFIKRNKMAWTALIIGSSFGILVLVVLILMMDMCVVC